MIITSQGFGHFTYGINNQDFGLETPRMVLVLDGCSDGKYSEVGTRLFAQILSRKKDYDNHEMFEKNVKEVFEEIMDMMSKYYASKEEFEDEFIMENLLFTIIACFETDEKFIVKVFGDGYIFTINKANLISYMRLSYGKCPPYFAYKYCEGTNMKNTQFKTFEFDKKLFSKVGIASDGILPIVKGEVKGLDDLILAENALMIENAIKSQKTSFYDDVTIGML